MSGDISLPVLKPKDFESDQDVRWCPRCGDYSILAQMKKMLPSLGVEAAIAIKLFRFVCVGRNPEFDLSRDFVEKATLRCVQVHAGNDHNLLRRLWLMVVECVESRGLDIPQLQLIQALKVASL